MNTSLKQALTFTNNNNNHTHRRPTNYTLHFHTSTTQPPSHTHHPSHVPSHISPLACSQKMLPCPTHPSRKHLSHKCTSACVHHSLNYNDTHTHTCTHMCMQCVLWQLNVSTWCERRMPDYLPQSVLLNRSLLRECRDELWRCGVVAAVLANRDTWMQLAAINDTFVWCYRLLLWDIEHRANACMPWIECKYGTHNLLLFTSIVARSCAAIVHMRVLISDVCELVCISNAICASIDF